jgi:hypothetical protein
MFFDGLVLGVDVLQKQSQKPHLPFLDQSTMVYYSGVLTCSA